MRQVALDVHLRFLAVRGRWQRYDAKHAGAAALGDRPYRTAFSGGVAALEDDDDPLPLRLHPILHQAELGLKPEQVLFIGLAFQLAGLDLSLGSAILDSP